MALEALLILLTLAILVGLGSGLYYVLRNTCQWVQHCVLTRSLHTRRAGRNGRPGNAQQRVQTANQPARNASQINHPPHVPYDRPTTGRARRRPSSPSPMRSATSPRETSASDGEQNRLCVVCLDNEKQVLLRPCKHYCVCEVCSRRLRGECPICRSHFTSSEVIHIFYD